MEQTLSQVSLRLEQINYSPTTKRTYLAMIRLFLEHFRAEDLRAKEQLDYLD
jgi:hypothetical protein